MAEDSNCHGLQRMKTKHYKIYKIISQVYYPGKLAAEQKQKNRIKQQELQWLGKQIFRGDGEVRPQMSPQWDTLCKEGHKF